jgi:acyl dehydratase
MTKKSNFDAIPIGLEMGPLEIMLDEEFIRARINIVQWEEDILIVQGKIVPPGLTISQHAGMKFKAVPELQASIWAKSEHEFLKPMRVGDKITIRGRIVDKYVKRERNYIVAEYETLDESGDVLMKSRETAVHVE